MHTHRIAVLGHFAICLLGLLTAPGLAAQEASVRPGINRHFTDPEFNQWVARFERPGREVYDHRYQIVAATGVGPGMVVADIGAGTGLFTRLFAAKVGDSGKVYAVDIAPAFVDNIVRISRAQGQRNVEGVVNSAKSVSLPPHSIDLAFICDTYHHFEYPRDMMASLHRALKPDGSVAIIDFRKIPGFSSPWVMGHVRAGEPVVVGEIEAAGFRLVEDRDFLTTSYFLRFVPVATRE
jgi:predicted methyltransferase